MILLVLVETPLQLEDERNRELIKWGHNPCFSGNSFATCIRVGFRQNVIMSQSLF